MKKITILVPVFNEASNLDKLILKLNRLIDGDLRSTNDGVDTEDQDWNFSLKDFSWEFLFVNDGSSDTTLNDLRRLRKENNRINIVNLSRNFGKESAMLAGLDYALGDAVIIMDADLQDPVDLIPQMIYWWLKGYDDVYGKRADRGKESWIRKRLSLAYYSILQHSTRIEVLPNVGDFRLLDRRVVEALKQLRETQRYTKGLFCWVGFPKKEIIFNRVDRNSGKSSFKLTSLINLAIEGITSFTTAPLRFATLLGFFVSLISLGYMIFILLKTLIFGDPVQGFPTLICALLFLGGVQLIALGIIGEYIGRIFNETKGRPVYIVESYNEQKA
ncbi:MAG: glycosyltransferase family 2 protein [Muribaculaceae bacterium]|nr:glycosyltransferase family 2 protein [Muribaculaceae bacterium]